MRKYLQAVAVAVTAILYLYRKRWELFILLLLSPPCRPVRWRAALMVARWLRDNSIAYRSEAYRSEVHGDRWSVTASNYRSRNYLWIAVQTRVNEDDEANLRAHMTKTLRAALRAQLTMLPHRMTQEDIPAHKWRRETILSEVEAD